MTSIRALDYCGSREYAMVSLSVRGALEPIVGELIGGTGREIWSVEFVCVPGKAVVVRFSPPHECLAVSVADG